MEVPILYKYRDWNNKYHKRILTENELYFSSAKYFNDPFDARLALDYTNYEENDWYNKYFFHLQRMHPNASESEIEEMTKEWVNKKIYNDPQHLQRHRESVYTRNKQNFGVVSLAAVNNDILLWAHYAAAYTGFCVGFNKDKLLAYKNIALQKYGLLYNCFEVEYTKEYPVLDAKKLEDDEIYVITPLTIKSDKWLYEKEYRLILINGTNKGMILPSEIYEEIILGVNISQKNKDQIVEIAQKNFPQAKILQAQISDNEYRIELFPLNSS